MTEVFHPNARSIPVRERRGDDRPGVADILVVEDAAAARAILRRALEDAGYRVREAADGAEALEIMYAAAPDLVLLDLEMPVMDGRTLLRCMRVAGGALEAVPVVVLTSSRDGGHVAELLGMGAQDYVRKPCDPPELEARVAATLLRASHERQLRESIDRADQLSTTDALTGLANRRFLLRRSADLRQGDPDAPVGVLLADVDHFKRINDVEGHHIGDAVLRIVAKRLAGATSPGDLLVRWGGEEFMVLAVGRAAAGTRALAHGLHRSVGHTPVVIDGRTLDVRISVGCASGSVSRLQQLVATADAGLYEAKRTGRDRVVHRMVEAQASGTSHSPPSGGRVISAEKG